MSKTTKIEWCDSTVNPTMGCDGCELHNRASGVLHCYAGQLTDRYGGTNKGFPEQFEEPTIFDGRIADAVKWKDLTGTDRTDKPWLNGMPRLIFVGDMGDTFTQTLMKEPEYRDWLASQIELMADSPHQWLMLTKRPNLMASFSKLIGGFPKNVWPGASVTKQENVGRVDNLIAVEGGGPKFMSCEPLLEVIDLHDALWPDRCRSVSPQGLHCNNEIGHDGSHCALRASYDIPQKSDIDLVICGGESGHNARSMPLDWAVSLKDQCQSAGVPFFMKQLSQADTKDFKDFASFPKELQVREMPEVKK